MAQVKRTIKIDVSISQSEVGSYSTTRLADQTIELPGDATPKSIAAVVESTVKHLQVIVENFHPVPKDEPETIEGTAHVGTPRI